MTKLFFYFLFFFFVFNIEGNGKELDRLICTPDTMHFPGEEPEVAAKQYPWSFFKYDLPNGNFQWCKNMSPNCSEEILEFTQDIIIMLDEEWVTDEKGSLTLEKKKSNFQDRLTINRYTGKFVAEVINLKTLCQVLDSTHM